MDRCQKSRVLAASILFLATFALPFTGAANDSKSIQRLRDGVAAYPNDPDLAWALALELVHVDHPDATSLLIRIGQRWPHRRHAAAAELGRVLYKRGEFSAAVDALETATAIPNAAAWAHMYHGLALRRLGRLDEADAALLRAAELDPALRGQARTLQALNELRRGDRDGAAQLLDDALAGDTSDEAERLARALRTGDRGLADRDRWQLTLFAGAEADTNPQGDNDTATTPVHTDELFTWGAHLRADLWSRQDGSGSVRGGYRFDQTRYDEEKDENWQRHLTYLTWLGRISERVSFALDSSAALEHENSDPERWVVALRPSLIVQHGASAAWSRFWLSGAREDTFATPSRPSRKQDGESFASGIDHVIPLPWLDQGFWRAGFSFSRRYTDARRDDLGFASTEDRKTFRYSTMLRATMPWGLHGEASGSHSRDRYLHRSVDDFQTGGTGRRRRDSIYVLGAAVRRELVRGAEVELYWTRSVRRSNVDLFDNDRDIVGLQWKLVLR